jgi:hypothetical protein
MWSFGVLMYKTFFGADEQVVPLGMPRVAIPPSMPVQQGAHRSTVPVSSRLRELLEGLLVVAPRQRLNARDAVFHAYFQHVPAAAPASAPLHARAVSMHAGNAGNAGLSGDDRIELFESRMRQLPRPSERQQEQHPFIVQLSRKRLVSNTLHAFRPERFGRGMVLRTPTVHFIGEEGVDLDGLQKDLFMHFFEQVVLPDVGLFEGPDSTPGGGGAGVGAGAGAGASGSFSYYLPAEGAAQKPELATKLETVGVLLLKVRLSQRKQHLSG